MSELELEKSNSAILQTILLTKVPNHAAFLLTNDASFGNGLESDAKGLGVLGNGDEAGVEGRSTGPANATHPEGTSGETGVGVRGIGTRGVYGESNLGGKLGNDYGVKGVSGGFRGVWGSSIGGEGLFGDGTVGVRGQSSSNNGVGVRGVASRNLAVWGSGLIGIYGDGTTGVVAETTSNIGIALLAQCPDPKGTAGFFRGGVDVVGAKGAVVPFPDGSHRRLYSMESPESWFEDFGEASLVDGKARVHIDPDFAAVISGEYHVFVTPYGDSNGLYVHRRDHASFEVREHKGGTSTFTFSYRIIARRKDIEGRRLEKVTLPSFDRPKMPTPL